MYEAYHVSGISNKTKGIFLIILGIIMLSAGIYLYISQNQTWHDINRSDQSGLRYQLKVPSGWKLKGTSPGLNLEIYKTCINNNLSSISMSFIFASNPENIIKNYSSDYLKQNYQEEKKIINTNTLYSYSAPGNKQSLSYLSISKGYFLITPSDGCSILSSAFPQILSTLQITE
jgi:hypothetical protein